MTILAMVNADKEGQIESKMMKSRQMEEIREARKAEAEKREQMRKGKLEDKKDSMRKKKNKKEWRRGWRCGQGGSNQRGETFQGQEEGIVWLKLRRKKKKHSQYGLSGLCGLFYSCWLYGSK